MGIFGRLGQLIKSNLNHLISQSEDPEKMLTQIIHEMGEQLIEVKKKVVTAIAEEKKLAKQAETFRASAEAWQNKAIMAVRAGNDELAKAALQKQAQEQRLADEFEKQHQKHARDVATLKTALQGLENRISEARREKELLIARNTRAVVQIEIQKTLQGIGKDSSFDAFNRMKEKVEKNEAMAEAGRELADEESSSGLDAQFEKLAVNSAADQMLADLKAKVKGLDTSVAPVTDLRVGPSKAQDAPAAEVPLDASNLEQMLASSEAQARRQNKL